VTTPPDHIDQDLITSHGMMSNLSFSYISTTIFYHKSKSSHHQMSRMINDNDNLSE